jgi:hypothetical protein
MRTAFASLLLFLAPACFPALAQSCGSYKVVGTQCARTVYFGWGTAGLGTNSSVVLYVPGTVSAPVTFQLTQLNSSLGTSYSGFFGVMSAPNQAAPPALLTAANATPNSLNAGQGAALVITQVCFNAACTAAAPTGAVANMFSMQFQMLSSNAADLAKIPLPFLNVRFLDATSGVVNYEEQEVAVEDVSLLSAYAVDQMDEASMPGSRYTYTGTAVNLPFVAVSITNPSATQTLTGTLNVLNYANTVVATAPIAAIPPLGAAGYLLIGRTPSDALGLLSSSTVLPTLLSGSNVLHGAMSVTFNSSAIFLAQEFDGNAMLNLVVEP